MRQKPLRFSVEDVFNYSVWSAAVCYALYKFHIECEVFDYIEDTYNDFATGWSFLGRKQDVTDTEWRRNLLAIAAMTPWFFAQLFLSELLCRHLKQNVAITALQCIQLTTSSLYLATNFPLLAIAPLLFVCLAFRVCSLLHNFVAIWLCTAFCAIGMHSFANNAFPDESAFYLCEVGTFWMILRCSSYCFDKIKSNDKTLCNIDFFAYCFYIPLLFLGPFITFHDYRKCLTVARRKEHGLRQRIAKFMRNMLRIAFWVMFTELAMHYVYSSAMIYLPEHVATFNSWSLYGFGYAMGQFFHLKYVVSYGCSLSFSELESIEVPRGPKCIGRIHLYSDMWKYFDEGFYKYLLTYVYIPLCGKQRKIIASTVTFFYVYIWHGYSYNIFMWTLINFACILAQKWSQTFMENTAMRTKFVGQLSEAWRRRLVGVFAAPLLSIAVMSNAYFFAHTEIGDLFFAKFFQSDIYAKCTFFFLLYFLCQVSMHYKRYETANHLKTPTKIR